MVNMMSNINKKIDALCATIKKEYEMRIYDWDNDVAEERARVANEIIEKIESLKEEPEKSDSIEQAPQNELKRFCKTAFGEDW